MNPPRNVRRVSIAFAVLATAIGPVVTAAGPDEDSPDIRRVLLRPEQVPVELERVRRGVLRQMPQPDFEALVARAASADVARREPPRLVESRYRAVLSGESLSGSAALTLLNRQPTPGLLSLNPLNLAVRKAAWDDGTPALLGDLDPRPQSPGFELFVGRPGEQRLTVDWSARGVAEPAGLRFDLRVPACPVAVLELDLPADREPVVPHEDGLLTGPVPGPTDDRRFWRLAIASTSQITLTVRPVAADAPPLILARQHTHQEVSPGETACEFTFDLEVPHGGTRDLTLTCDPILRPTEVIVRNLDTWEVRSATVGNELTRVMIHLREPLQTGSVTLRAIARTNIDKPWTSPTVAVVGAVARDEALAIRVHPDLHLDDWRAGAFRLIQSVVTPDRWQVLTLQSGSIRTEAGRPAARLRAAAPDIRVRERLWWEVGAGRMALTAHLAYEVAHGPVFQLPLSLPVGWTIERIESDPADLLAAAPSRPAPGQPLIVPLQRALGPGSAARLTVHLAHGPPTETVSMPDVAPIGVRDRAGTLAVRIDSGLQSTLSDAPPVDPKLAADHEPAPWGAAPADYIFPLTMTAAEGSMHIGRQPARVSAAAATSVTVIGSQAKLTCRLRLEPLAGGADAVVVHGPKSANPWDWQVVQGGNRVRSIQRLDVPPSCLLAALAAQSPWGMLAAAVMPADSPGTYWRMAFARPLTEPVDVEAHVMLMVRDPKEQAGGRWAVPLIRVPGAAVEDHRVTLDLRSTRGWRVEARGVTDMPIVDGSSRYRRLRYSGGPATLALLPDDTGATPVLDRARLVTHATDPTRLVHRLDLRLWNWDRASVPLDLPADSVLHQARVNGVVAIPTATADATSALHVTIPAPAAVRSIAIEVVYSTPCAEGGMFAQLTAGAPVLPIADVIARHIWCLPPGVSPLWPRNWRTLPKSAATDLFWSKQRAPENRESDDADQGGPESGQIPDPRLLTGGSDMFPADINRGTFWEPIDPAGGDLMRVVRARDLGLIGGVSALAFFGLAWLGRARPPKYQWTLLLVWLGLSAISSVWLPEPLAATARWPLLSGVLVACWLLLRGRPRSERSTVAAPRQSAVAPVLTAGLIVALWFGGGGRAAAPGPVTVYLVPGASDAAPVAVLTPPDLLDRLEALGRRGPSGLEGAAWLDARYEGRVTGPQARFNAVLRLHSFVDDPPPLVLPLTGVQIGDAKLDGTPAFLRAAADRYLVPIHGRGSHTLEVEFTVPCPSVGDDRELRFGIPEAPMSRLTLTAPATANYLRAVSRRGGVEIDTDAGRPRLNADLGRVGAVNVRWRAAGAAPATVRNQETYLWNLTESEAKLFGAIRYEIGPGSVTALTVNLPPDLEVLTVAARPLDAQTGAASAGWLRAWRVTPPTTPDGRRSLVLEFAAPIDGHWQVNLELVPRELFAASFALPFPSAAGDQSAPPVLAWRAQNIDMADEPPAGATLLSPDAFLRDHWLAAKIEADPLAPTSAYQLTAAGQAPTLQMRATIGPQDRATADIHWRIGPRRADVEATARQSIPGGRVSLVEWTVPAAVAIAIVRGPDVHAWSRTGSTVQVWLAKPVAEAEIQIVGSVDRAATEGTFDVPPMRPMAADVEGTVRVSAREGIVVKPVLTTHLTESAASAALEWSYTFDGPQSYRATFDIRAIERRAAPPRTEENRPSPPPPGPRSAPGRVEFMDVEVARGDDGRWVHRATLWLTRANNVDVHVAWPRLVCVVAVDVDGRSLPGSTGMVRSVSVPISAGSQRLQLVWASDPGGAAPAVPEMPALSTRGESIPAGPAVWTLVSPPGTNIGADAAPIPAAAAALYRAAAQIRLADAGRLAGPTMADAAKAARARAANEVRRADTLMADTGQSPVGPGGITLSTWRQQLVEALRPIGSNGSTSGDGAESPYDEAFSRGGAVSWYIPACDDGPRLTWPAPHSDWAIRLMRTVAILVSAVVGYWLGRRFGAAVWPEQMMLLGAAAWAASGGMAWQLPAVVGITARCVLSMQQALQRWRPASDGVRISADRA